MSEFSPKTIEMCFDCNKDICRVCTVEAMAASEAGQSLKNNPPRFGTFKWPDVDRFREFMGPDVDNFMHGPHQADTVALPMVEYQNSSHAQPFTEREARLLYFTHMVHDLHEYLPEVGDVSLPEKIARGREWEMFELAQNRWVVAQTLSLDEDDFYLEGSQAIMGDFDGETFLGRAFKAGEYVGYLNTGLRAWAMREHSLLDYEEWRLCYDLGQAVLTKNTPTLQRYAAEFPYIQKLLDSNAVAILEANSDDS